MRPLRSTLCTLFVFCIMTTTAASQWSPWRSVPDGAQGSIEFRYQIDTFNYDGQRLIDWQFRSLYPQKITFDYEITLETIAGPGVEQRTLTLEANRIGGGYRLGLGVTKVIVKNLRFG